MPEVVKKHYQKLTIPLHNLYGPTEASVDVTFYETNADDLSVPIGSPISNIEMHVVDADLRFVPIGVIGEICISGVGLARGYLNNPELTADRFIVDPVTQKVMYKTGDRGRWLENGKIEYLGREDNQIKIRGHRIELGEIENVLLKHDAIGENVVIPLKDDNETFLVVYYAVAADHADVDLKSYLQEYLPAFMVPSYYIRVDQLPRTPTGKIDRKQLPAVSTELLSEATTYVGPRNAVEEQLVSIWQDVLKKERVGVQDNFFKLGGHSLKMLQVSSRIFKEMNFSVDLGVLFSNPTIEELAVHVLAMNWIKKSEAQDEAIKTWKVVL
jgi:acyl-coenzyme A synthetase/AMP-(fatty) acid ligase/aryl carrier-like protein